MSMRRAPILPAWTETLNQCIITGTVAILDGPGGSAADPATWSDLAIFSPTTDPTTYTLTLLSADETDSFAAFTQADAAIDEGDNGDTVYAPTLSVDSSSACVDIFGSQTIWYWWRKAQPGC